MEQPSGLDHWTFTAHARAEMVRRRINEFEVALVLLHPAQRIRMRDGRDVFQRRFRVAGSGDDVLVRVFVDVDRSLPEVVTAYRTSKIDKYWRLGP